MKKLKIFDPSKFSKSGTTVNTRGILIKAMALHSTSALVSSY
jgi:hypothetical protein